MKVLLVSLNDSNKEISRNMDKMNDNLSGKMDTIIDLQEEPLVGQGELILEVRDSRKDFKDCLDRRFEKLESEVYEMRTALKAKGII